MIPYFCGGIFFSLICRAKVPQISKKKQRMGQRNTVNAGDIMEFLDQFLIPGFVKPINTDDREVDGGFRTYCTNYMKCEEDGSNSFLPLNDTALVTAFDDRIKNSYGEELNRMHEGIDMYLMDNDEKRNELVTSLLSLIHDDTSLDGESFYCLENGAPITKEMLMDETDICLDSFLLGIWHFIATRRPENKPGKDTFLATHKHKGGPGTPWVVNQDAINPWHVQINVSRSGIVENEGKDKEPEHIEGDVIEDAEEKPKDERSVTNNYYAPVLQQNAEKIMNVDHIDTLNF